MNQTIAEAAAELAKNGHEDLARGLLNEVSASPKKAFQQLEKAVNSAYHAAKKAQNPNQLEDKLYVMYDSVKTAVKSIAKILSEADEDLAKTLPSRFPKKPSGVDYTMLVYDKLNGIQKEFQKANKELGDAKSHIKDENFDALVNGLGNVLRNLAKSTKEIDPKGKVSSKMFKAAKASQKY